MNFIRIRHVFEYGRKDAELISQMPDVNLSKSSIFRDILKCFFKYNMGSNEYKKERFWQLPTEQREEIGRNYYLKRKKQEEWSKGFFENHRFLIKWSSFKYESSSRLQRKRRKAYCKRYNIGDGAFIGHGVIIDRHHYTEGKITIGNNCHIAEQCVMDYTGGLKIGNKVTISENVKILTHKHPMDFSGKGSTQKGVIETPLFIDDYVGFGARVFVLPGVDRIGRGANIAAAAVVKRQVPPYAIVMGNPARVVGFRMTPEQIVEFEKEHYEEKDRLPLELLEANYQKYFLSRIKEIQQFLI